MIFFLTLIFSLMMIANMAKLICWNYRGLFGRDTSSCIKFLIRKFKPLIFCLVETWADNDRLDKFCSKLGNAGLGLPLWPIVILGASLFFVNDNWVRSLLLSGLGMPYIWSLLALRMNLGSSPLFITPRASRNNLWFG